MVKTKEQLKEEISSTYSNTSPELLRDVMTDLLEELEEKALEAKQNERRFRECVLISYFQELIVEVMYNGAVDHSSLSYSITSDNWNTYLSISGHVVDEEARALNLNFNYSTEELTVLATGEIRATFEADILFRDGFFHWNSEPMEFIKGIMSILGYLPNE